MKTRISDLKKMKKNNEIISMLTAYDFYSGKLIEEAGIDAILVGDSLGMVMQGNDNTLPVTLDEMIYHTKMVARGIKETLLVTDLPFMTFQKGPDQALTSAGKILKKTSADAVKVEGGTRIVPQIEAMVNSGIPVMGHLGLTPQSVNQFGGFSVQGQNKEKALELVEDALALEEAGVFSIVLETVPKELAEIITDKLSVPTIGIGAGANCDGQILVLHDLLGVDEEFTPNFVRKYVNLNEIIIKGVKEYIQDVKNKNFPAAEESYSIKTSVLKDIEKELD